MTAFIDCTKFLVIAVSATLLILAGSQAIAQTERLDMSAGMNFEAFLATGRASHIEKIFARMKSLALVPEVKSSIMQIDVPLVLFTYGSMSCSDCTIALPVLEAMRRQNPQYITTLYQDRDLAARELLLRHTGRSRIPTVLVLLPDGTLLDGAYVEHPRIVYDLLDSSRSEEEKRSHIEEFRAGKYDEQVQADLADLIFSALRSVK